MPRAQPRQRWTTPVIVTGAAAAACVISGVAFGIDAISKHSSYSSSPAGDTGNAGERSAFYADLSLGAAALFGITAAALYFIADDEPAASANPGATAKVAAATERRSQRMRWVAAPAVLPRGGGVSAAVQF